MSKAVGTPKKLTVKAAAIAVAIASAGYIYKTYFDGPATSFVGPAAAEGELDTSRLPRVAGTKDTYVSGPTTIFVSPDSVAATAEATAKALAAEGWLRYERPFTATAENPDMAIMSMKKGVQGLNVFITVAPAQGNKTSVSYTAIAFANDLPVPADATSIEFDPDRPYVAYTTTGTIDATMSFLKDGLVANGWSPWSAKEEAKKPEGAAEKTDNGLFSYFVRDGGKPVIAFVQQYKDGSTHAKIELVPEILLTPSKQKKEEVSEAPVAPEPSPESKKMDEAFDQIAGEILNLAQKATSEAISGINKKPAAQPAPSAEQDAALKELQGNPAPIPVPETALDVEFDGASGTLDFKSSSAVHAVASFYRKAMKPAGWKEKPNVIDQDNMVALHFSKGDRDLSITVMQLGKSVDVSVTGSGLVTAAAEAGEEASEPTASSSASASADAPAKLGENDLQVQDVAGLPVPTPNTLNGSEKSLYRLQINARVAASVETVLAFYRRELGKRADWKEAPGAVIEPKHAVVTYTTNEGPAVLTIDNKDGETVVALLVRKQVEATKSGMLPKPGNVKLLFGNVLDGEASVTIDKKTVKIAAGLGGKKPDGPTLEIAPGKHKFSFKLPGQGAQTDEVEVAAGDIWGLLVGPGGVLALQMY